MTITTKPGAQPAGRALQSTFDIYEVDEYDTIRRLGAREPKVYADLFPDIDPSSLNTSDDYVAAGEEAQHLGARFEGMLAERLSDQQSEVEASRPTPAQGRAAQRELRRLKALHDKGWQTWVRSLDAGDLERLRKEVADWWLADIDWYEADGLPMYCGSQGEALSVFEALPYDCLEALGADLVYGVHPGSSYYAAELPTDIDEANAVAERLGLDIRFVRQGESAEPFLGRPTPPLPLPDPLTLALAPWAARRRTRPSPHTRAGPSSSSATESAAAATCE